MVAPTLRTSLARSPSSVSTLGLLIRHTFEWQVQTIGAARARDWTGLLILWLLDWFAWTLRAWAYFHAALPEEEVVKRLGPKGSWARRLRTFLVWGKDRPVHGMDLVELRAYQFLMEGQVQSAMYITVLQCCATQLRCGRREGRRSTARGHT